MPKNSKQVKKVVKKTIQDKKVKDPKNVKGGRGPYPGTSWYDH